MRPPRELTHLLKLLLATKPLTPSSHDEDDFEDLDEDDEYLSDDEGSDGPPANTGSHCQVERTTGQCAFIDKLLAAPVQRSRTQIELRAGTSLHYSPVTPKRVFFIVYSYTLCGF